MANYFDQYLAARSSEALSLLSSTGYAVDLQNGVGQAGYNAIRHVYVSAMISYDYGTFAAYAFGYGREYWSPAGPANSWDTFGDLWNNEIGRRIAHFVRENYLPREMLAELVADAFSSDEVIITRQDHRLPSSFSGDPLDFNNSDVGWVGPSSQWFPPVGVQLSPPDFGGMMIAPCFAAGTPILLADGRNVVIEDIAPGMRVAAFDERDARGAGELTSGLVTRLIPGLTTEWIVLDDGTRVTPGHRYLCPPSDAHSPVRRCRFTSKRGLRPVASTLGALCFGAADSRCAWKDAQRSERRAEAASVRACEQHVGRNRRLRRIAPLQSELRWRCRSASRREGRVRI